MRNVSVYGGLSDELVTKMEAAGVDLAPVRERPRTYLRLPKGRTLHADRGCSGLKNRKYVEEQVDLLTYHKWNKHETCNRWSWGYNEDAATYASAAGGIAEVHAELQALEALPSPAHGRLGRLLAEIEGEELDEAVETVFPGTERAEEYRARARALQTAWLTTSRDERSRPFVVEMLSCPRESVKALRAVPGAGLWRAVQPTWQTWSTLVADEQPLQTARNEARTTWERVLQRLEQDEQELDVDESRFDALVNLWERTLKKACEVAGPDVVLAYPYLGYGGLSSDPALQKAASAFPGHLGGQGGRQAYVLRVPEAVAEWLCRDTGRYREPLWLGAAHETDTDAVLETFAALWDPSSGEALASARSALTTARVI